MSLRDRKILTFDVMGTLIDFETGVLNYFRPIAKKAGLTIGDAAILSSYGKAEDAQHQLTPGIPFTNMLAAIYRSVAAEFGLPNSEVDVKGLRLSMELWPAFPDSVAALKQLRTRFRLVAMTNADNWALSHFSRTLEELCLSEIKSEHIEGVNRQELVSAECVQPPERPVGLAHLSSGIDACVRRCNSACRSGAGDADVARRTRRHDQDIRAGSNRSTVQHVRSAMAIAVPLVGHECPLSERVG